MDEQSEFLKYIYQEDLFLIDEPQEEKKPSKSMEIDQVPEVPEVKAEPKPMTFFGKNKKGVLILVNDANSEFLNENDLSFLMKIIEAGLKFSSEDIALVNLSKFSIDRTIKEIPHKYLISFATGGSISMGKPLNQVIDLHGKKGLFSHELHEISMDVEKKKALWKALQSMFDI